MRVAIYTRTGSWTGGDVRLVRTRGCDALVASDPSRFTRNASDLASILADAAGVVITDGH